MKPSHTSERKSTMSQYKYQEEYAQKLTEKWLAGYHTEVRITIRQLKKAQAAYLAAAVAMNLGSSAALSFVEYIHPNHL
jgi:hypothetical protein